MYYVEKFTSNYIRANLKLKAQNLGLEEMATIFLDNAVLKKMKNNRALEE